MSVGMILYLDTQSVVYGPKELASTKSLLETQNPGPTPDLLNWNLHFNNLPKGFIRTLMFEKHCFKMQVSKPWLVIWIKWETFKILFFWRPFQKPPGTYWIKSFGLAQDYSVSKWQTRMWICIYLIPNPMLLMTILNFLCTMPSLVYCMVV